MKKLWKIVLVVIVGLSLCGCGSNESDKEKEEKPKKEETKKFSDAEQLKKDNPDLYERATGVMVQVNMDLENGLEGVSQVKKISEYPYIDMFYKIEKNNVNAITCNYSFIEEGYVRIEIRTYFNLIDDSLESVQVITSDASLTEESIIFALTHINDFTLSTNIQETLALKEVLRKTDESYMVYTVANKWTTVKSINNTGAEYKIEMKD